MLLFSYFLFLWNSQIFLQLKMDFICIITRFDCLMKNNSMQTLMLNCPFKIFLLSRLCWSVLSFIYHLPLLSQSLPSIHAAFQRERKNERHFYSYPHLLPGSPFFCMFSLFPKIPCLESVKWKGGGKLTCQENMVAMLKNLFFWRGFDCSRVCRRIPWTCMSEWVHYQNQQNPFKSHPCKTVGNVGL